MYRADEVLHSTVRLSGITCRGGHLAVYLLVLIVAKCCEEYVARRVYLVLHERLRMCTAVKAYYIANTMHKAIA